MQLSSYELFLDCLNNRWLMSSEATVVRNRVRSSSRHRIVKSSQDAIIRTSTRLGLFDSARTYVTSLPFLHEIVRDRCALVMRNQLRRHFRSPQASLPVRSRGRLPFVASSDEFFFQEGREGGAGVKGDPESQGCTRQSMISALGGPHPYRSVSHQLL